MSAFLMEAKTTAILAREYCKVMSASMDNLNEAVKTLAQANLGSLDYRYPDHADKLVNQVHVEECEKAAFDMAFEPVKTSPIQMIKHAQCFDYQSCEVNNWNGTEAAGMLRNIISSSISKLDGYSEAEWG